MIDRKFVCAPDDIEGFKKRSEMMFVKLKLETDEERIWWCRKQFTNLIVELESYGLEIDDITVLNTMIWVRTEDLEDFHYAIHHLIFQMWWAGEHKLANIPKYRMWFFAVATKDCYVPEQKESA
jgi:hypothetical protein